MKKMRLLNLIHPTQKEVDASSAEVDTMTETFGHGVDVPSTNQRRRTAKLRKGALGSLPQIATLARRYGADLPGMPVDEMEAKLELAQRLRPLVQKVGQFFRLLNDIVFVAESEAWQTALTTYKVLRRMAKDNVSLKQDLAPIEAQFSTGSKAARAAKGKAAPAPAPVVTPAPPVHVTASTVNVTVPPVATNGNGSASSLNGHG